MSVKGSTALIRLAQNPECEVLGAMVMQSGSEKKFYESVIGAPYDREFGERQSSRRRATQFEQNAYAGDGRLLREALAEIVGVPAKDVRVHNLLDDHPGTKEDARIARLRVTRKFLVDSIAGRTAPHILIQPQLLVTTSPGQRPYFFISPDILVWSHEFGRYLPGDLKSFVVRENEVEASDLARTRLQLGAQALALGHEYHRIDPSIEAKPRAILIFSKPNGLRPHDPRIEDIGGAIHSIRVAIAAFLKHRVRVDLLRGDAEPYTVAADLEPHFQENCLSTCVMAAWCRQRVAGKASDLGDAAKNVLGDVELAHLTGLMLGTIQPANEQERAIAEELIRIAAENGIERAA
jgi:hypothetical protein